MGGLSATAGALEPTLKRVACAAMLGLPHANEDLLPLIVRLEERVKFAGQIRDDGITEYRAVNFNGSLEAMPARAARTILHRLEGLRDSLRSGEAQVEPPIILRGEELRRALADLPAAIARQGGERGGWLSRVLNFRQFDRNLPALIGTLEDMLSNPQGEPLRFASADYDTLEEDMVHVDGTIEPGTARHVLVDHIAFRDDRGEVVWIFVCRTFLRQPQSRQPRTLRESTGDFEFMPSLAPQPVPVPVRVRK